jgi:hypothetical protein
MIINDKGLEDGSCVLFDVYIIHLKRLRKTTINPSKDIQ